MSVYESVLRLCCPQTSDVSIGLGNMSVYESVLRLYCPQTSSVSIGLGNMSVYESVLRLCCPQQCYFSNVYEYGNENGYYSFYENGN